MNAHLTVTRLLTDKKDLGHTEIARAEEPAALEPGEVRLKLDLFSVTTNNITYAAFGDAMNYWGFFPTGRPGWGHMPVWGFADVEASTVPGVEAGERFYGYFPIASHVRMRAERVTARGFYDGGEHRRALTSAYNQYTRCSSDPAYAPQWENYQALFRPLFITSFMLADFLEDNDFFGAKQLLVSSASSKTAYGTAFCLAGKDRVSLTGLTSARNSAFVRGLGCYEKVTTYEELETLDPGIPTLYVDFAGDESLRARIHHHFGAALAYDCYAGSAANTGFLRDNDLPGPKPAFYFAPVQIRKRNTDWGPAVVNERFNAAQAKFVEHVAQAGNGWVKVVESQGFADAQEVIRTLAQGGGDPAAGHILRLG